MAPVTVSLGDRVRAIDGREGAVERLYGTTAAVRLEGTPKLVRFKIALLEVVRRAKGVKHPPGPKYIKRTPKRRFVEVVDRSMAEQQLTWLDLGARTGLSRSTIARFLRDADGEHPARVQTLERIAAALGLFPGDFWER